MKLLLTLLLIISAFAACCQTKDSIPSESRIFFIGFSGTTLDGYAFSGGIDYIVKGFPNVKEAREFIARKNSLKVCYITSIYEFKSRKDYYRFWKNNNKTTIIK